MRWVAPDDSEADREMSLPDAVTLRMCMCRVSSMLLSERFAWSTDKLLWYLVKEALLSCPPHVQVVGTDIGAVQHAEPLADVDTSRSEVLDS